MSIPILLASLIAMPGLAHADPVRDEHPARSPDAPEDRLHARFARALEVRVGEVLDRRTDLATSRAVALLEAREAERLGEAAVAAAWRDGQPRALAPASSGRDAVAVRWTRFSRAAGRSAFDPGL